MEWLATNWFWIVLGLGLVWLVSRGGRGCGMGGHGARRSDRSKSADPTQNGHANGGHTREHGREAEETGSGGRRRRRGC